MPNERFTHALSRLEAAAQRLDALVYTHEPAANATDMKDIEILAERHRKLRAGTAEALARLDRLIAGAREG